MPAHPDASPPATVSAEDVEVLLQTSRALVGVAARSLARLPAELTLPQVRALVVLSSRGPVAAGALAETLGAHPSSLTRLVDRLERRGLVTRTPGQTDRREVVVGITAHGERLVRQMTTARRRELRRIMARLDQAERSRVVEAFAQFASAAGEAGEGAWALGWAPAEEPSSDQAGSDT